MSEPLEWRMKVGRRKIKRKIYPVVQLPAEFRPGLEKL